MARVTALPAVGSRWRHWRCTDTNQWDRIVLAVVEHDGVTWVVCGDVLPVDSPFSAKPDVIELPEFVTKFSEVA